MTTSLDRDAVTWAYRLFLDREPENDEVINGKLAGFVGAKELREHFLTSPEFKQKNGALLLPSLSGDEPPMFIEDVTSDAFMTQIFQHIQDVWQSLGETEPYWSVLTVDEFELSNIENTKQVFYETGKPNADLFFRSLERNGIDHTSLKVCLEYGCGLGRITRWLAERFDILHAYDISLAHLSGAEAYLTGEGISNVRFHHLQQLQDIDHLYQVDAIYSVLVLQHNPPPIISLILGKLVRALKPGGIAFLQVPTYRLDYRFAIEEYLRDRAPRREMEIHVLPQRKIFEIVEQEHGRVVEVIEDMWLGYRYKTMSNTFLIQKQ